MKRNKGSKLALIVYNCNPALRRLNLKDPEFGASQGYIAGV